MKQSMNSVIMYRSLRKWKTYMALHYPRESQMEMSEEEKKITQKKWEPDDLLQPSCQCGGSAQSAHRHLHPTDAQTVSSSNSNLSKFYLVPSSEHFILPTNTLLHGKFRWLSLVKASSHGHSTWSKCKWKWYS